MSSIVKRLNERSFYSYPDQIYALYVLGFAGPPYYEAFRIEELSEMSKVLWFEGEDGLVLACYEAKTLRLQGFYAGYCVEKEPEVCKILSAAIEGFDPSEYFYMAEVVTHPEFRGRGVASVLTKSALEIASNKYRHFVVRTNVDNCASIKVHKKIGFHPLASAREEVVRERTSGEVANDKRIFLTLNV